jgi:hypothetical protein
VFFALARRYVGRGVALVGMLLLAVAPYQVWYAQEARFYAWSTLLALLATYALLRALDEPHANRFWIVFGLSSVAGLYNQPLSAAVALAGQMALAGVWLLFSSQRRQIVVKTLVTYVLITASYWPVFQRVNMTGRMDAFRPQTFLAYHVYDFWVTLVGAARETVDKFAAGGVSSWLFLALFLVGVLAMARQRRWKLLAVCLLPLLTALLAFAAGRPRTGFIVRYVLYLQPIYLLAVAVGLTTAAAWVGKTIGRVFASHVPARQATAWAAGIVALGLLAVMLALSLWQVQQSYTLAKINDWRAIARYLDAHIRPGDLIVGNRWFEPALSWYLQRTDEVTMSTDRNESVLDDLYRGRRTWYLRLGPTKGIVRPVLERKLETIAPEAWQEPGWNYVTTGFFPVSEYMVLARFIEGEPTAMARFYDVLPTLEDDLSHRFLRPGERVHVQLALAAGKDARFLDITHYANPQATLSVTIDEAAPIIVSGQENTWLETRLPVPASAGDTVTVRVQNVGQRADKLHKLQLTYDEGAP